MSPQRFYLVLCGLLGFGFGIVVALGIAAFSGRDYADLVAQRDRLLTGREDFKAKAEQLARQQQSKAERKSNQENAAASSNLSCQALEKAEKLRENGARVIEVQDAEVPQARVLRAALAARSAMHNVPVGFQKAGLSRGWGPWVVSVQSSGYVELHFDLLEQRSEGHLLIEIAVAQVDDGDGLAFMAIMFEPEPIAADLKRALSCRNKVVNAAARILDFSPEELARTEGVLQELPMAKAIAVRRAMMQFVALAPESVQRHFQECLLYEENPHLPKPEGVLAVGGFGPAIGMTLSDRWLMDIVFGACEEIRLWGADANVGELGPWWSIVLRSPEWRDNSSADWEKPGSLLEWPRLTVEEVERTFCSSP